MNIDLDELGYAIFGSNRLGDMPSCWFQLKQKFLLDPSARASHIQQYEMVKPFIIKKAERQIIDKINDALPSITIESTKELKDMAESLEKLDKIGRLEEGKATEHIETTRKTFSLRDIVASAKKSKEEIEDVEYIETANDVNERSSAPSFAIPIPQ